MSKSYSQVGQDLFVMSMFPSHYKGTFLDVGCNLPENINNTKLLEENDWNGFSIDIVDYSKQWEIRKTPFICANALQYDYENIPRLIDYLTLDVEGSGVRFQCLKRLIDLGFEFKVITIEHDAYRGLAKEERKPQRTLLLEKGYSLYRANVCSEQLPFEDWWINLKYIKV